MRTKWCLFFLLIEFQLLFVFSLSRADIYTYVVDPITGMPYHNLFLTSYAPYRFLAACDDDSGNFPYPTDDPVNSWNPASLVHQNKRILKMGFDNPSEKIDDSYQNETFSKFTPSISNFYYIEPPSPFTLGVIALGWKRDYRNFDISSSSIINSLNQEHWSGGLDWALKVDNKFSFGIMIGYQRLLETKQNDWITILGINGPFNANENYKNEEQGFYGKFGFIYSFIPNTFDLEGSYGYGGSMNGLEDGYEFYDREPTLDAYGNDFFGWTFHNIGAGLNTSIKLPDTLGGMIRYRPLKGVSLFGGASKIFWSQYYVELYGTGNNVITVFFNGQIFSPDTIKIIPQGLYQDIVQYYGGFDINLFDFINLKAMIHTDPDPDQSNFYQDNMLYYIFSATANFDTFLLQGTYSFGQGTSIDNTFNDTIQNFTIGATIMLGVNKTDE